MDLDISCYHDGVHGDVNATYFVGNVDETGQRLVRTCKEALDKAIQIGQFPLHPTLFFFSLF